MNFSPFPVWNTRDNCLDDGILFDVPSICGRMDKSKCIDHYKNIADKKGFFVCPAGLSSYSIGITGKLIFSGIRVAGHYDITKLKRTSGDFLPTLPPDKVSGAIGKVNLLIGNRDKKHDIELMNSSLHEIRKFNAEIKRVSEELMGASGQNNAEIIKNAKTIFAASSLISVRLNIFDFDENPGIVTSSSPYSAAVFGKFEKSAHVLEVYAKRKSVTIKPFKGSSYKKIDIYPAFEFLPFVIMENAVKYSPRDQDITVEFEEFNKYLEVTVSSVGPVLTKYEIERVFEKGARGVAAVKLDDGGGGYGLYFAKMICDLHDIEMQVFSSPSRFHLNGIDYSDFRIKLVIK